MSILPALTGVPGRRPHGCRATGAAALLVLAALGGACGDPTAPPPAVAGRYVLRSVGNSPLPADLGSSAGRWWHVVADTLVLAPDSTFAEIRMEQGQFRDFGNPAASPPPSITANVRRGRWAWEGRTLVLRGGDASPFAHVMTWADGAELRADVDAHSAFLALEWRWTRCDPTERCS